MCLRIAADSDPEWVKGKVEVERQSGGEWMKHFESFAALLVFYLQLITAATDPR